MVKKVFKGMLLTQVISFMTVLLCMLIDSIMIGKFLGVDRMVAYGLATPVLLVFSAFGSMISASIQVITGKALGSGDKERMSECFTVSLISTVCFTAVGMLLVFLCANPICTLLGAGNPGEEIFELTKDYLIGFIIGAPPFLFAQIMVPYLQIAGKQNRVVVAVLCMIVSDISFDLLNVFVFKGDILGMGLASSFSYYVAFVIGVGYFFKKSSIFKFKPKFFKKAVLKDLFRFGIPTVINQLSMVLFVFFFNKILLSIGGNEAVASYSVISTVGNLCYCLGSGISAVSLTLSSIYYTEEDRSSCIKLVDEILLFSIILNAIAMAIVIIFAPFITELFLNDESARELTIHGMRLFATCLIFDSMISGLKLYYQGIGKIKYAELICFAQNFFLPAMAGLILGKALGVRWIWLAWLVAEGFGFLCVSTVVVLKRRKFKLSSEAYSLLPDDFGTGEGLYLETVIRSEEDVVKSSEEAYQFCLGRNRTQRESYVVSLAIEEMCTNIVKHGFGRENRKDSLIELKLFEKGGKLVIRITDASHRFDPLEYLKLHSSDDPTSHIGMRMVRGMISDAKYVNTLGLNCLTLTI